MLKTCERRGCWLKGLRCRNDVAALGQFLRRAQVVEQQWGLNAGTGYNFRMVRLPEASARLIPSRSAHRAIRRQSQWQQRK